MLCVCVCVLSLICTRLKIGSFHTTNMSMDNLLHVREIKKFYVLPFAHMYVNMYMSIFNLIHLLGFISMTYNLTELRIPDSKHNIDKLKSVQQRAAEFLLNVCDYRSSADLSSSIYGSLK